MSLLMTWLSTEAAGLKAKQDKKIGIVGAKIIYSEVRARAKVLRNDQYKIKKPEYEKWVKFVEEWRNKAPISMRSLQQASELDGWIYMVSEAALITSAWQGIAISGVFVFLVLLGATRNIVLAIYTAFCVGYIMVTVGAIIVLNQW